MKKFSRTFIAGSALILLANAVALAGVAYNRSNEPESSLRLTQRELRPPEWRMEQDNSGITLALDWRVSSGKLEPRYGYGYPFGNWGMPAWLDQNKLAQLGFDVSRPENTPEGRRHYGKLPAKDVLLVLEMNGPAYQRELQRVREYAGQEAALQAGNPGNKEFAERAKRAGEYLRNEENKASRLFVIDAGLDLAKLRAAYPERTRYAIVHGQVQPRLVAEPNKTRVEGYISKLSADRINVPLGYRQVFGAASKYETSVAFGKRLEPWLVAAVKSPAAR